MTDDESNNIKGLSDQTKCYKGFSAENSRNIHKKRKNLRGTGRREFQK